MYDFFSGQGVFKLYFYGNEYANQTIIFYTDSRHWF